MRNITQMNITSEIRNYTLENIKGREAEFDKIAPEYAFAQWTKAVDDRYEVVEINGVIEDEADCNERILHWAAVYAFVTGQFRPAPPLRIKVWPGFSALNPKRDILL